MGAPKIDLTGFNLNPICCMYGIRSAKTNVNNLDFLKIKTVTGGHLLFLIRTHVDLYVYTYIYTYVETWYINHEPRVQLLMKPFCLLMNVDETIGQLPTSLGNPTSVGCFECATRCIKAT